MNVDTGQFEAITGRLAAVEDTVAALAQRVADCNRLEQIMARAGMPEPIRAVAEAQADRERDRAARHLRAVE